MNAKFNRILRVLHGIEGTFEKTQFLFCVFIEDVDGFIGICDVEWDRIEYTAQKGQKM